MGSSPIVSTAAKCLVTGNGRAALSASSVDQAVLHGSERGTRFEIRSWTVAGGALLTIMITDLVGSTEMHARLGDEAADSLVTEHVGRVRDLIEANDGMLIKSMGDGVLATFRSARRALECAAAIQRREAAQSRPLHLRVGLAAGEVIERDADVYGIAVNTAARIAARAAGGEILLGDVVRQLAGGDPAVRMVDRGLHALKGIPDEVRLLALDWGAPAAEPRQGSDERTTVRLGRELDGVGSNRLVGRDLELARLRAVIDGVTMGRGAVMLVGGEAGIGKPGWSTKPPSTPGRSAATCCGLDAGRAVGPRRSGHGCNYCAPQLSCRTRRGSRRRWANDARIWGDWRPSLEPRLSRRPKR